MISDFIVMHPCGPFFRLDADEFNKALQRYPELDNQSEVDYVERSATASIHLGQDAYFDSSTVLEQFERLFRMLQFKKKFTGYKFECIVDNARTHTSKSHSILDFGKKIGTRCPVDKIEYIDDGGVKRILDCFFKAGPNKGLSKGLFEIARELRVKLPHRATLEQIRGLLAGHSAFQQVIQQ